jgi:Lrp/AsnC family transcriptional regulator, regulator for asnA, asnC and gidA
VIVFATMSTNSDENRLSDLDARLIALLQRDAYRPNTDIARELRVGESTVRRRVQALIRHGYLKIIGVADPFKLGFAVWVVIGLQVDPQRLDAVAGEVARMPEVAFVAVTTGSTDIWVNAMFRSNDEVYEFISSRLGQIRGIRKCETATVLRVTKRSFAYGSAGSANGDGETGAPERAPRRAAVRHARR